MDKSRGDRIYKYLADDLSFRASLLDATAAVREMQGLQNTYPIATNAVGRTMVGALLMASNLKEGQMVSLYFRGDGPMEIFFAEATFEGEVRGHTPNPQLIFPDEPGLVNVGRAIGRGLLTVVRSVPHQKGPQRGNVELQSGEVGDDIAFYLYQSHQVPSVVAVSVKVNAYGLVQAAGGILIELLPDAPEKVIEKIEANLKNVPSISEALASGKSLDDLALEFFKTTPVTQVPHAAQVKYSCRCSKDRFKGALKLLGPLEVGDMLNKKEEAKARCELCGRTYTLTQEELMELFRQLKNQAAH